MKHDKKYSIDSSLEKISECIKDLEKISKDSVNDDTISNKASEMIYECYEDISKLISYANNEDVENEVDED